VIGDWLPIAPQSFTRQINTSGTGTCDLDLISNNDLENRTNLAAVLPRKSVLWVLQDDAVVWNGIIWDWAVQTILGGVLPLSCATMESILAHRLLQQTFTFTNEDVFDMFRTLVQYALSPAAGRNAQVAGISYTSNQSGIRDTVTFDGTQYQLVSDAIATLVSSYEIEYSFRPYQDSSGNFRTSVDLAYPYLGQSFPASGLVYNMPGNLTDYGFAATGSTSANYVIATAQPSTDSSSTASDSSSTTSDQVYVGTAIDNIDLNAGYPLSQVAVSIQGMLWNSNSQARNYANGYIPQVTDTQLTPLLTVPGGRTPLLRQVTLGSAAQMAVTSDLHPAAANGGPGYSGTGRITGWTLNPPSDQQPETIQYQLGDMLLSP
jgi:hypothetical protein